MTESGDIADELMGSDTFWWWHAIEYFYDLRQYEKSKEINI